MKNRILFTGLLALSALISTSGYAVPLLRQTAADFNSAIVTIYPDSDNPNLFYFMPNTGAIAKDKNGAPLVSLTYKGLAQPNDTSTMGFMTGVFEAGLTKDVKAELQSFKQKHPSARLTVVPFGKSFITFGVPVVLDPPSSPEALASVPNPAPPGGDMAATVAAQKAPPAVSNWSGLGAQNGGAPSALFRNLYLPPSAGVAETQEGFNALLSKDGTIIFANSLKGLNPMNMHLCYQIYGALPTMKASITINYQRVYSYFQASASGGWGWWGWSVAAAVEKLRENGDIKIVITGANEKMEDYVLKMAESLATRWMTPTLIAAPGPSTGPGFGFNRFAVNGTYKEENKEVTYTLEEQKYITDDRCMALPMSDLAPFADKILINADGGQL